MKNLLIGLLLVSFFSCNNVDLSKPKYQPVSVINDQIKIRMSIPEFLDIAGHRAVKSYEKVGRQQYLVFQYDEDDNIIMYTSYYFDFDRGPFSRRDVDTFNSNTLFLMSYETTVK